MAHNGFLLGSFEKKPVFALPEQSVLMFGPPGSGKSLTIAANLLRAPGWDCIIYDPPGTIRELTQEALIARGYDVRCINVDRPEKGIGYNPMSFLQRSQHLGRDVAQLVDLLLPFNGDTGASEYFGAQAQNIAIGFIRYLWEERGTRFQLADLVRLLSDEAKLKVMLRQMQASGEPDAMAASAIILRAGEKGERGGILNSVLKSLRVWSDEDLVKVCGMQPWWWEQVFTHPKPVAVFLEGGMGFRAVCGPYARMAMGLAILEVQRMFGESQQPLRKGLRLFIDEAKELDTCSAIVEANDKLRKAGVRTFMGWLAVSDLKNIYGADADNMIGTSTLMITGGVKCEKTLRMFSELAGRRTVRSFGESKSDGGTSESEHETGVPLIYPDQIRRLSPDEQLAIMDTLTVRLKKPWRRTANGQVVIGV